MKEIKAFIHNNRIAGVITALTTAAISIPPIRIDAAISTSDVRKACSARWTRTSNTTP